MITQQGIEEAAQAINSILSHVTYKKNEKELTSSISKRKVSGETIFIYAYLDDEVEGNLSEFKLISISGQVFATNAKIINKPNTKGLLVRFKFVLKEVELGE